MKKTFQSYGKYYDIIYADKNYEKECDFLERIFRKYLRSMPKTILDAGCGTGGHAVPLAKRGYEVTGIDYSEVMINIAKQKARESGVNIDFYVADLRELRLNRKFDACVCMFAVIDYLIRNKDVQKALLSIRRCLMDGALFIFDFWYGPAVLTILPSPRIKIMKEEAVQVVRFANPRLDSLHHVCEVNYNMFVLKEKKLVDEVEEKHLVRYFFPKEIEHYLEESGFKLLKLCPFLNLNEKINEKFWNAVAISKAL